MKSKKMKIKFKTQRRQPLNNNNTINTTQAK